MDIARYHCIQAHEVRYIHLAHGPMSIQVSFVYLIMDSMFSDIEFTDALIEILNVPIPTPKFTAPSTSTSPPNVMVISDSDDKYNFSDIGSLC